MNRSLTKRIVSLLERRQLKETLARIAMVLSCLAIFFITYLLIAPVLTQEWVAKCGMEEHAHTDRCYTLMPAETGPGMPGHIHTDDCYSIVRVDSVCPIEEHVHNDGCYSVVRGNNICGGVEHVHSSGCYSTVRGENVCGRTEHVHSDGCWDAEGNLICGMEEHFHEDSCFAHHEELVCAMQEHVHSDSCFEQERVLVCMREEHIHSDDCCSICDMKQHIHTGACYDGLGNLLCGTEEHIHTDICFPHERRLTCGLEETAWQEPEMIPVLTCGVEEHTHTSECYSIGEDLPAYTCGFLTEHVHSADCYFESGELKCTLPEHVHNESCLPAQQPETPGEIETPTAPDAGAENPANGESNAGNYICGFLTEHVHSADCYFESGELKCTLPEHVHNESCLPAQQPETPDGTEDPTAPDGGAEGPANGDPNAGNYICGYVAHIHNDSCLENGEWICALPEHVHNESCLPVQQPETPGWSAGMGFPDVLPEGYVEVYSVPMGATFGPEETGEELTTLVYAPQNAFGGEMVIFVPQPLEALEDGGYTYTAAMDALAGAGTGSDAIVTALDLSFMSAYSYQSLSPDTSTGPVFVRLTMPAELPEGAEPALWHYAGGAVQPVTADFSYWNGTLTVSFAAASFSPYIVTASGGRAGTPEDTTGQEGDVTWGQMTGVAVSDDPSGLRTWDVTGTSFRELKIPIMLNVTGNTTITLPGTLNCPDLGRTVNGIAYAPVIDKISDSGNWQSENTPDGNVILKYWGSGQGTLYVYYVFDCWNVISDAEFTVPYTTQKNGGRGISGELRGKIHTGHDVKIGMYETDSTSGDSLYSFSGFGGTDKKTAYIQKWNSMYETYFGLKEKDFDSAKYVYDIAPFLVSPEGQQPYDISGTLTPDQGGEVLSGVYMMDSRSRPDDLCLKSSDPASGFTITTEGNFTILNDKLMLDSRYAVVTGNLADTVDSKAYTLYFLVRYPKTSITDENGYIELNASLSLTHAGIDSNEVKTAGPQTACLYAGNKDVDTKIYWASYVSNKVVSSTGLTSLKKGSTAALDFAADFFCLNQARSDFDEDSNRTYRLEAIIDLSYLDDGSKKQLGEGDYRFTSYGFSLIDADGSWSQDWNGGSGGWAGTPNVGWGEDKFNAPGSCGNIEIYGSTSLTDNSDGAWTLINTVNGSEVWAINKDRGIEAKKTYKIESDKNYVRLKVVYDSRMTTALRVGYQMELKPDGQNKLKDTTSDSLNLVTWFNYLAYTADGTRDPAMSYGRFPVSDGGGWDAETAGTIESARQHDADYPYPGYESAGLGPWDPGYSLRNFAKAELKSGADVAGMIVTQSLYDSAGTLVGDPTSIDPVTNSSFSLQKEVINASEVVYSISGVLTNGASSLEDMRAYIYGKEGEGGVPEDSPYRSLKMRYYVLLPEGLTLNTNPDNGETDENGAPKYHFWTEGTTPYLSANSAFYSGNSSKVVQSGQTDIPVSDARLESWQRVSANGSLSEMYWVAGGAVTHDIGRSGGQLVVFERTLGNWVDYERFNMWGTSETYFWGRGLSFSVVPTNGVGSLRPESYEAKFWCQFLDENDNPISLNDFAKKEANSAELDAATGTTNDPDTLLYIPIDFHNSADRGGSKGELTSTVEEGSLLGTYEDAPVVALNGTYQYQLTYTVEDEGASTSDVVLWCNVEEYTAKQSAWHGVVTGVMLPEGLNTAVYVRKDTFDFGAYLKDADKNWLSTDGWTKIDPQTYQGWSSVKAIAFSFEEKTFVVKDEASVFINMTAPGIDGITAKAGEMYYPTYNEYLVTNTAQMQEDRAQGRYQVGPTTIYCKIGFELPSTGGAGTAIVYAAGTTFILTAGCLMYQIRRRSRKERGGVG